MGSKLQFRKKKKTENQKKILQEMKLIREKKRKQEARDKFLAKHKLIKIKNVKQAEKFLKELNDKCEGCSKLLGKDEIKLRDKLNELIKKEELKLWMPKNEAKLSKLKNKEVK